MADAWVRWSGVAAFESPNYPPLGVLGVDIHIDYQFVASPPKGAHRWAGTKTTTQKGRASNRVPTRRPVQGVEELQHTGRGASSGARLRREGAFLASNMLPSH